MHLDVEVVAEFQTPEEFENRGVSPSMTEVLLLRPVKSRGSSAELRPGTAVVLNRVSLSVAQPTAAQQCFAESLDMPQGPGRRRTR